MARITTVKAIKPYTIWVQYNDGVEGEIDLSHLAGKGVFAAWNKTGEFEKAHLDPESGAVAWGSDLDICPDTLYLQLTGKTAAEYFHHS